MGQEEEDLNSPEKFEPIEVNFGDIVEAIHDTEQSGDRCVVVGLSQDTLLLDGLAPNEDGSERIVPTYGTHYGGVKVIGAFPGGLPTIINDTRETLRRNGLSEAEIQEAVDELELESAKGPVMFTPSARRTKEEFDDFLKKYDAENGTKWSG